MTGITSEDVGTALILPCEHGPLHGTLTLQTSSPGLVVLAHTATVLDGRDNLLAGIFRHAGLSTLNVDLLARKEEHFTDVHNNVPLLAKRLLEFLGQIRHRMLTGEIREQPIGLCAANVTSPVVIRIAAQRDHDIAAIVCRGGLIDLAGALFLRTLASPLLLLHEQSDTEHLTSNQRALKEIPCHKVLKIIPDIGFDYASSIGFEMGASESARWFIERFGTDGIRSD